MSEFERAAQFLKQGKLVAFPTETVYGLGADASNPEGVRRIFAAKGRPANHPLIVHLPGAHERPLGAGHPVRAEDWPPAFGPDHSPSFSARRRVIDEVTGGQDTVGLRAPSHPCRTGAAAGVRWWHRGAVS